MFHSTSGKAGFHAYRGADPLVGGQSWSTLFNKNLTKEIMIKENELRLSDWAQKEYSQRDTLSWIRSVTKDIQNKAVLEVLSANSAYRSLAPESCLEMLKQARFNWRDDPDMANLTVYQKYDHSQPGVVKENSAVPEVPLYTLDLEMTSVHTILSDANHAGKLTVILAGSVS